jgi:argininosuccinate lyase
MSIEEMKAFSPYFEEDVYDAIALSPVWKSAVSGRSRPEAVLAAIKEVEELI